MTMIMVKMDLEYKIKDKNGFRNSCFNKIEKI